MKVLRALLGLSLYYIVLGQEGKFFLCFHSLNLKVQLAKDNAWFANTCYLKILQYSLTNCSLLKVKFAFHITYLHIISISNCSETISLTIPEQLYMVNLTDADLSSEYHQSGNSALKCIDGLTTTTCHTS